MITGTVPPLWKMRQGVKIEDGVVKMLEEGDNVWVLISPREALYLNTETYEIIKRRIN